MTIRNPNAPCKGCTDRTPECHGSCEMYKEFCKKCQELREKRLKASLEAPYGYKMRMMLFGWNKDKKRAYMGCEVPMNPDPKRGWVGGGTPWMSAERTRCTGD